MRDDQQPGCLGSIKTALGLAPRTDARTEEARDAEPLPYHLRDDFLSPGELNFYRVLRAAAGDWAVICPKVSLGDLFYARTGDYGANAAYLWDFDDLDGLQEQGYGQEATWTFLTPGYYIVTLQVSDPAGKKVTRMDRVRVKVAVEEDEEDE